MGVQGWNLSELQVRAFRATAKSLGVPVAGKSFAAAYTTTDVTQALEGDSLYVIVASSAAFIGAADSTVAANRLYLPAGQQFWISTPPAGVTLYGGKMDDVG